VPLSAALPIDCGEGGLKHVSASLRNDRVELEGIQNPESRKSGTKSVVQDLGFFEFHIP
jgi:hypothetical protein